MLYSAIFIVMFSFSGVSTTNVNVEGISTPNPICGTMYACEVAGFEGDWMAFGGVSHNPLPTDFHTECLICDWQDGIAGICHFSCTPEEEEQQDQEQEEILAAYVELLQAFESGDPSAIVETAQTEGWPVVWQADRGALQLLGCDGESVLASYTPAHPVEIALNR